MLDVNIEPKLLVGRLNPTCLSAMEMAARLAMAKGHATIGVEHLFISLLELPRSDLRKLCDVKNINWQALREELLAELQVQNGQHSGRPAFSSVLLKWLERAWVIGSLELSCTQLRSGLLWMALIERPLNFTAARLSIPPTERTEVARAEVLSHCRGSVEDSDDESSSVDGGGLNALLADYTEDLTAKAREGKIDPVLGRENEIRTMTEVMLRRRKNHPILIGEPGVGKSALVEGLAINIVAGLVPEGLKKVRLLSLDLGAPQAGASVKGEFERRLKGVVDAVKASAEPIVLFIDEAHTLIGAGGQAGGSDAANLLKPALARGELRAIAATTYREYKKYFEKDAALERRFQPVKVDAPSVEQAVIMLRGLKKRLETAHQVHISEGAILAAAELSNRYIPGRHLPDKAVDLLDTAAAVVALSQGSEPPELVNKRAALSALEAEAASIEADQTLGLVSNSDRLEQTKVAIVKLQDEISNELERLSKERALAVPLIDKTEELTKEAATSARSALAGYEAGLRQVFTEVDEIVVANVIARWTGVPVGKMFANESKSYLELESLLAKRVRGQDDALRIVADELRAAHAGVKSADGPRGVFLLVGPSGVGKTETALAIADTLFGGEGSLITINMSEFQERHTTSRLIGSPPGYVGYGEGGVLTEAVRHKPYSVVLLDEVEKADRDVMNLFYQVFDKGMLSDGEGRLIDFRNTTILMTSNIGTDTTFALNAVSCPNIRELIEALRPELSEHFKPALLARMTTVPYLPMRPEVLKDIVTAKIAALIERVSTSNDVQIRIDDSIIDAVVERCSDPQSGARNIEHILRTEIYPLIARRLLTELSADGVEEFYHLGMKDNHFDWVEK